MEKSNYENLQKKWDYIEQFEFVHKLIDYQNDMLILGGPGCGKSTFIEELIKEKGEYCIGLKVCC